MSNSKMLIDASHPEETRVVVLKGNRIEEFDFEAANRKQLRGNIYLAKVTRVEPSLQAAFVEYGGNRHGFLAFSEIHPDYYQIPFADRQALLEEEARAHRDEEEDGRGEGGDHHRGERNGGGGRGERSDGRGERNGEGRGERGGEGRGERGGEGRSARGDRGGRGERQERGDRNQRRSRRHRRDGTAPMDRRGPADERVSEPAFEAIESDDSVASLGVDSEDAVGIDRDAAERTFEADLPAEAAIPADASRDDGSVENPAAEEGVAPEAAEAEHVMGHGAELAHVPDAAAAVEAPAPYAAARGSDEEEGEGGRPAQAAEAAETVADVAADETVSGEDASSGEDAVVASTADRDLAADDEAHDAVEARDTAPAQDDEQHAAEDEHVEQIGGDALSDVAPRPTRLRRHYKIQEVIKRRQILLIQVVKEERGNKGAALTTYLSLAGRYSVLMPNTAKGGGISRKITDGEDRKRLKAIAQELDVPEGMGVILRTAGAARSPIEVRRDFEYLLRMWESVRELTLKSSAPTLVYEEGSLIKRSIRDLYSREVEEVVVAGDAGFTEARDFMRMLMPGNVKSVQHYRDPQPIFAKSGVEAQLDAMFSAHVTLKSGGYIVINQTEALVAIDVNSGRSTREHNIEDTALRTNMEAADEVARQLRLRDLAGLIVVDFIDMDEGRNNRAVERRIKDALKNDRARIQIGRISHFGLLEMSRQRIRTGVLEGSTVVCPHCAGAGTVRSTASIALHVLRLVEDALIKDASHDLIVRSRSEVALYVLNQKRAKLVELEQRFGVTITVTADPTLTGMVYHAIERGELATPAIAPAPRQDLVRVDSIAPIFEPGSEFEDEAGAVDDAERNTEAAAPEDGEEHAAEEGDGRRRKRRRRRRGRDREGAAEAARPADEDPAAIAAAGGEAEDLASEPDEPDEPMTASSSEETREGETTSSFAAEAPEAFAPAPAELAEADAAVEAAPRRRRSRRTVARSEAPEGAGLAEAVPETVADDAPARPRRRRPSRARAAVEEAASAPDAGTATGDVEASADVTEADAPASTDAGSLGSRPSADRDVGADTVEHHPPLAAGEVFPLADAESTVDTMSDAAAPPAADVPPPSAEPDPDPDRPKRSGWWQRAKASFGS